MRRWLHLAIAGDEIRAVYEAVGYFDAVKLARTLPEGRVETVHGHPPDVGSSYATQVGPGKLFTRCNL